MEPRELGGVERMTLALDRIATVNFTTIARVRGRFDDAQLRHALDALARRHPTLTARLCRRGFRWYLEPNTVHSIGCRHIDADPQAWVPHAEAETRHETWRLDGPRARCIWLRHGEADSTLLLTFHHVISDGKSMVLFALSDTLTLRGHSVFPRIAVKGTPLLLLLAYPEVPWNPPACPALWSLRGH